MRKNIPYNTENPSAEELLAFLKGSMNVSDTQKMEQSMDNDPLLSDALSGLREMKSPDKLLSIQSALNAKISTQLIGKEPVININSKKKGWQFLPTYYAAAASIILILGFSFFFYQQTKEAKDIFDKTYKPAIVSPEMSEVYEPETQEEAKTEKITSDSLVGKKRNEQVIVNVPSNQDKSSPSESVTYFEKEKEDIAPKAEEKKSENKAVSPQISTYDERDKAELKEKFIKVNPTFADNAVPAAPPAPKTNFSKDSKTPDIKPSAPAPAKSPAVLPAPVPSNNISNINIPSLSKKSEEEMETKPQYEAKSKKRLEKSPTAKTKVSKPQAESESKTAEMEADEAMTKEDIAAQKVDNEISDIYLGGISKYEAKDYEGALEMFNKIPKKHSYRTNADFFAANCYLSLKKQQEAIHLLKPLSEKANWNYQAEAKWYLGMAYLADGQKKKAAEVLKKLLAEGGGTRKAEIEKVLKEMGTPSK